MVNVVELKAEMLRNGYTQEALAKEIGITPRTFSRRMKDKEFGSTEIKIIMDVLKLRDPIKIFFADWVTFKRLFENEVNFWNRY